MLARTGVPVEFVPLAGSIRLHDRKERARWKEGNHTHLCEHMDSLRIALRIFIIPYVFSYDTQNMAWMCFPSLAQSNY